MKLGNHNSFFIRQKERILMMILGVCVSLSFASSTYAADPKPTGSRIFREAADTIACKVVPGKFGAMVALFSGTFAIIAAVTGSYKGAWALLFVSIGAFIFPEVIKLLFKATIYSC